MEAGEAQGADRDSAASWLQRAYSGGRHEFMQRGDLVLTIPNPHGSDISIGLLKIILRQAGLSKTQWEKL